MKKLKTITVMIADAAIDGVEGVPEGMELKIIDFDYPDCPMVHTYRGKNGKSESREMNKEESKRYKDTLTHYQTKYLGVIS